MTEELVRVLIDDGYPSSHPISKEVTTPYELEAFFDDIETAKAAAIIKMVEYEEPGQKIIQALIVR